MERWDHSEISFLERILRVLERIERKLDPERNVITEFTVITQGDPMVPLAAGQTATFSTTAIPATSVPNPAALPVWTSSDTVNAPVSVNTADPTGLSTLVAFPETVVAGVVFSLTITYTNSDGTTATQTDSFTTVAPTAPPSPDITGFTSIVQSA